MSAKMSLMNVVEALQQRYGTEVTDQHIKKLIASGIKAGAVNAMNKFKEFGHDLAMKTFGVEERWGKLEVTRNSTLERDVRAALEPEYEKMVQQIVQNTKDSGKLQLGKRDLTQLTNSLVEGYKQKFKNELRDTLDNHFAELAARQAEEVKLACLTALHEDGGAETILAEHFNLQIESSRAESLEEELDPAVLNAMYQLYGEVAPHQIDAMAEIMGFINNTDMDDMSEEDMRNLRFLATQLQK